MLRVLSNLCGMCKMVKKEQMTPRERAFLLGRAVGLENFAAIGKNS
jgi:hypothetical protein